MFINKVIIGTFYCYTEAVSPGLIFPWIYLLLCFGYYFSINTQNLQFSANKYCYQDARHLYFFK